MKTIAITKELNQTLLENNKDFQRVNTIPNQNRAQRMHSALRDFVPHSQRGASGFQPGSGQTWLEIEPDTVLQYGKYKWEVVKYKKETSSRIDILMVAIPLV